MKMTLSVPLNNLLTIFKLKEEFDPIDDVYHDGYTQDSILKMNLSIPKKYENLEKLAPKIIAIALEDSERQAWARDLRKAQIKALISNLENINPGSVEYQDGNGNFITKQAQIISANYNKEDDTVSMEIMNPHHLINGIVAGVGLFSPDLDIDADPSQEDILSKIHNLPKYFEVYGESLSKGDLPSYHSPTVSDQEFFDAIESALDFMTNDEMAEALKESVDSERLDLNSCLKLITDLEFEIDVIKESIINEIKSQINKDQESLKKWNEII